MVAARSAAPESLNLPAPRARPASVLPFVPRAAPRERRAAARAAVALFAWVCTPEGSGRAYALNVSTSGAQLAGSGVNAAIGARVLVKLVCDPAAAALVLPARVVRSVGGVLGVAFVRSEEHTSELQSR